MSEKSKSSGEIGEKITTLLLEKIGWKRSIYNVSIACNTPTHINDSGNQRSTHGEDQIFLYHSPFHDDRTDFVHVSVKNTINEYPTKKTLIKKFKSDSKELHEIMTCAKYSPELQSITSSFQAKKHQYHSGLLVFLSTKTKEIEKDIKGELSNIRLDSSTNNPIYLIDNERASFLLNVVDHLERNFSKNDFDFFYPKIGTSVSVTIERTGKFIPLELIGSDIITAVSYNESNEISELILYANSSFDSDTYTDLISYGLNFATGLVKTIRIGMANYNPASDEPEANHVRLKYHERTEEITPFCFKRSILDLVQG